MRSVATRSSLVFRPPEPSARDRDIAIQHFPRIVICLRCFPIERAWGNTEIAKDAGNFTALIDLVRINQNESAITRRNNTV